MLLIRSAMPRFFILRAINEVKDPAVDLIYFAAEEWAEVTNWRPGPSDA